MPLRDNHRKQFREPSKEPFLMQQQLFWSNCHLVQTTAGDWEASYVGGTLHRTTSEATAICPKEPQKTNISVCPKTIPENQTTLGDKREEELKELRDMCKEVIGEPSTEPCRKQKGSAPQKTRQDQETNVKKGSGNWYVEEPFRKRKGSALKPPQKTKQDWETNVKKAKKSCRSWETQIKKWWGKAPQNLFGGNRDLPQGTAKEKFAPRPLLS